MGIIPEEDLKRLYIDEEKSLRQIGDLYGMCPSLVLYYVKKAKIETRGTGRPRGRTEASEEKLKKRKREIKKLKRQGLSNAAIGRKLGLSRQYIWFLLKK